MHNPAELSRRGAFSLGNAQLAEGTNAATIKTVQAIDFFIGGLLYSKAATDNIAITACAQQAIGTTALYLISINSSGTVTTTKGDEATIGQGIVLKWPNSPSTDAVIGGMKVVNTTNAYTAGTTDNSAAGVTVTYYNFMSQPQNSISA